jgi:hypothetical protein
LSSSNISRCLTRGAPTFDIFVAGVIALILAPTNIVAVALVFVFVLVWWLAGVGVRSARPSGTGKHSWNYRSPPPSAFLHLWLFAITWYGGTVRGYCAPTWGAQRN